MASFAWTHEFLIVPEASVFFIVFYGFTGSTNTP